MGKSERKGRRQRYTGRRMEIKGKRASAHGKVKKKKRLEMV